MADTFTTAERSRIMAAVKSRNTKPELVVRRIVHGLGYRYRLHVRELPGTPDIVLPRLRAVINVHGCFWHLHTCTHGRIAPATNVDYWHAKRARNAARDERAKRQLRRAGWRVMTVWECQMKDPALLLRHLERFLTNEPGKR